jgi:hypothetical protein
MRSRRDRAGRGAEARDREQGRPRDPHRLQRREVVRPGREQAAVRRDPPVQPVGRHEVRDRGPEGDPRAGACDVVQGADPRQRRRSELRRSGRDRGAGRPEARPRAAGGPGEVLAQVRIRVRAAVRRVQPQDGSDLRGQRHRAALGEDRPADVGDAAGSRRRRARADEGDRQHEFPARHRDDRRAATPRAVARRRPGQPERHRVQAHPGSRAAAGAAPIRHVEPPRVVVQPERGERMG